MKLWLIIKKLFDQPDIHLLYITAQVPSSSPALLFLRSSPRALLERFVGSNNAIHAPEWTRWETSSLEFQQPKRTFAALFVRFAELDENQSIVGLAFLNSLRSWPSICPQPGLSYQMAQWARSITVSQFHKAFICVWISYDLYPQLGSELAMDRFRPATPNTLSEPPKYIRPKKRRPTPYPYHDPKPSPSRSTSKNLKVPSTIKLEAETPREPLQPITVSIYFITSMCGESIIARY